MLMIGLTTFLIGLIADLIGFNRQLIEMTLEKVRRMELQQDELRRTLAGSTGPIRQVRESPERFGQSA